MRLPLVAMLLSCSLSCAQVLGIDGFVDDRSIGAEGGGGAAVGGGGAAAGGGGAAAGSGGAAAGGGGGIGGADCTTQHYLAVIDDDAPVSLIRFEEQDGATVVDEQSRPGTVGVGVDLDASGLPVCAGGSAVSFPGQAGGIVNFGQELGFPDRSSFSLEVWLFAEAFDGMVIRKLTGDPTTGYTLAFADGRLNFRRYANGGADSVFVDSSVIGTYATRHVVGTYDGGTQQICLYVDGTEIACAASTMSIGSANGDFVLGTALFRGVLDDVAVYSKALSPERVRAHYDAGMGASPE